MSGMETYHGHVRTPNDAIILFEACRIGLLPRVQRRLSEKERQSIKSGSVFVWDEREAGMRRWTDGKSWSASRVSGSFLTYREMEGKRGGSSFDKNANRDGIQSIEGDSDGGPDGYRYKPDGLMKQSFSITTNSGQHLHLISYFSRSSQGATNLMQPSQDPQLRHIRPEKGMYPESTVHEQSTIPAVTRGPMSSPGYTHSPHQPSAYGRGAPYPYPPQHGWVAPPSPMHTPPHHPHYSPYYQHPQYPAQSPLHNVQYPPHPPHPPQGPYSQPPPPTAYDRPPPPMSGNGIPPPPQYGQAPPQPGAYSNSYPYQNGYATYPPPPQQYQYPPPPPSQQYEQRPAPDAPPKESVSKKEDRADSHHPRQPSQPQAYNTAEPQGQACPSGPTSSGQTIPSISAMLNGGGNEKTPQRTNSRGSGGTPPRALQDIPSHKLGFEANRDVQALRNLDKTTFKGY